MTSPATESPPDTSQAVGGTRARRTKAILLTLVLAFPQWLLLSAAETSVLLIGKGGKAGSENTTVTGGARAIIKGVGDQTRVTADEIGFDAEKNALFCAGDSTVSTGGRVFKAKDITIELGGSPARRCAPSSA